MIVTENGGGEMARFRNLNMVEQLAVGLASGLSVRQWADRHSVPLPTAYRWRQLTPGFKGKVAAHRRRLVQRELDLLAGHAALRTFQPARQETARLLQTA